MQDEDFGYASLPAMSPDAFGAFANAVKGMVRPNKEGGTASSGQLPMSDLLALMVGMNLASATPLFSCRRSTGSRSQTFCGTR